MPFADSKSSNKKIRPNEIATDEHEPLTVLMNNWSLWNNDQDRFHLTFKGGEKLIFQEFYRLYKTSFFRLSCSESISEQHITTGKIRRPKKTCTVLSRKIYDKRKTCRFKVYESKSSVLKLSSKSTQTVVKRTLEEFITVDCVNFYIFVE